MASFCRQCGSELGFGGDDMAGLITAEEVAAGLGATALCEDCGYTLVDHEGNCMVNCLKHHNPEGPPYGEATAKLLGTPNWKESESAPPEE